MLGVPGLILANSAGEGVAGVGDVGIVGSSSGGFSEEERGRVLAIGEEGDRGSAGNRWPRQETVALLKIRCDMDVAFRDSTLKGPLWDEISRKMAELGFARSAKKCKEKFENVYKYHKRTKEGRASKADGKTYRFCEQLEVLESTYASSSSQPPLQLPAPPANTFPQVTVPSNPANFNPLPNPQQQQIQIQQQIPQQIPQQIQQQVTDPLRQQQHQAVLRPNYHTSSNSISSSSSTSSDETPPEEGRKRKRKWRDYFERLMRDVVGRQEELQRKFLDAIERRERERMAREESWRAQEMARMNKEHEILVQERAVAAAKDAALISFLQRMTSSSSSSIPYDQQQQQQTQMPVQFPSSSDLNQNQNPNSNINPQSLLQSQQQQQVLPMMIENTSSSRWPKAEVEALIRLRTEMDVKYQESGPKGPLWEEISLGMNRLGYERNSKRCKEKWENINKYFKKVKESSKKRPEDSKTCPYFHQLDALYRDKTRMMMLQTTATAPMLQSPAGIPFSSEMPLMVRPEQQWPHPHANPNPDNDNNPDDDDDEDEDDEDEESGGGGYEIVTNKHVQG